VKDSQIFLPELGRRHRMVSLDYERRVVLKNRKRIGWRPTSLGSEA
jgi:hypothetical protein